MINFCLKLIVCTGVKGERSRDQGRNPTSKAFLTSVFGSRSIANEMNREMMNPIEASGKLYLTKMGYDVPTTAK
ncbi:hypothetical protein V6N11_036321 [Hibiscus sabdariffa]|uniref:Uncharacterized protein n=1 Tax=Hibiscus sabdariffa TaxID=183260 RepID=A0ABR2RA25_9ROSI